MMRDAQAKDVRDLLAAGDFVLAFDTAEKAIENGNSALEMKHLSVLSLARSGATEQAIQKYKDMNLQRLAAKAKPASLKTDIRALWARMQKDLALACRGEGRAALLSQAASAYEAVFKSGGGSYPAINAATLYLLAGDPAKARRLATSTLRTLEREGSGNRYWAAATAAEARLILNDVAGACKDLARAAKKAGKDFASIAATRRQLSLVCDCLKIDRDVLDALSLPAVVHYAGHTFGERFDPGHEQTVRLAVREELARLNAGFGFGGLAAGADILFAEELLRRGSELHVVLPYEADEFRRVSAKQAGAEWATRFDRCIKRATSVSSASSDAISDDPSLHDYATKLAIGSARLRAGFVSSRAEQCVVWDGASDDFVSGIAIWRKLGLPASAIDPVSGRLSPIAAPPSGKPSAARSRRVLKALIFGDFKGFSKLQEHQIEPFTEGVLGAMARVIEDHAGEIVFRNTWGDGLYLVVNSSSAAARLALALQQAMRSLPLEALGLPPTLGLRLGAHFGPVFSLVEPITGTQNFVGSHVSRTARIEPVTPEGAVYVTDAFAADIAADEAGSAFSLSYVGNIRAAKGYGNLRMYALGASA
jgi:class 3 adenylate cyclase